MWPMEFPEAIKFLMKFITLHGTIFPLPGVIEVQWWEKFHLKLV